MQISDTITTILSANPDQDQAEKRSEAEVQARKHLLSLSENVISLIWCLAEANHKTLAAVNGANVHGLLIKVVEGRKVVGPGVALAAGKLIAPSRMAQCRDRKADNAAQALYSLSQDNKPFTLALLHHATAVPSIVSAVQEDHSAIEADLQKRESIKQKRKETAENGTGEAPLPDGRPLLMRVSLAGELLCGKRGPMPKKLTYRGLAQYHPRRLARGRCHRDQAHYE